MDHTTRSTFIGSTLPMLELALGLGSRAFAHAATIETDEDALDGVTRLALKSGRAPGKAKILLALPPLPLAQAVTVQLRNSAAVCWEAVYGAPATRNLADQFKDRSD